MVMRRAQQGVEKLVDLREGELPALLAAFAYFFFLLFAYYILRPVRDQMGLEGGVENLQWLFTATFGTMLAAVPVFGWLVSRFPRRRFLPAVYRFFIANLLIFFAIFQWPEAHVHTARAFFVWVSVFNLFVVSVFWSFMADIFSNAQGKRLFGAIAAGGTTGALLGPSLTALLAGPLGPVNLLLISAVLLEGAVFCIRRLGHHAHDEKTASERIGGGFLAGAVTVARSPYLLAIGLYIVLYTWTSTFLYFQQAEIVSAAFEDDGARTRMFAVIDLSVNVVTLALQLFVTGRFLTWLGTTGGLVLLPAVTGLGFGLLALNPGLFILLVFQSLRRGANYAIARPAREVLFTLVPREQKYKSKNFLDTVVYRGGDALTAWLYAGIAGLGVPLTGMAVVAIPVAGVWLAAAWLIGTRHERRAASMGEPVHETKA